MKSLFTITLLAITLFCKAQNHVIITSEEEYKYMTVGYKMSVVDGGNDMKKGYFFLKAYNAEYTDGTSYKFNFQPLLKAITEKGKTDTVMVGMMIIVKSNISGNTYYLAEPLNNETLRLDFESKIRNFDLALSRSFSATYIKYASTFIEVGINMN